MRRLERVRRSFVGGGPPNLLSNRIGVWYRRPTKFRLSGHVAWARAKRLACGAEPMYLWRKIADTRRANAHEEVLQARSRGALVLVRRPGRKRLQLEIVCRSRTAARALVDEFGGQIKKLPRDWPKQFARGNWKPISIGKRLNVVRSRTGLRGSSVRCPQRIPLGRVRPAAMRTAHATERIGETPFLIIAASAAFGTGEHVTTAVSLRLLEELTRQWKNNWSLVDLGTGSGILALAAKRFGAGHVAGIDNDPTAISTAKSNARLNNICNVHFQLADVRKWKPQIGIEVITANLYSDLLIQILPNLNRSHWLILSGILRTQEKEFVQALRRNNIDLVSVRRRGKWVAVLAGAQAATGPFILRRSSTAATVPRKCRVKNLPTQ
jgi:ribosomal protein L11 methyltransferase